MKAFWCLRVPQESCAGFVSEQREQEALGDLS